MWQSFPVGNDPNKNTFNLCLAEDMVMNSKYVGHSLGERSTTFFPVVLGFVLFFTLIIVYGRFPPNKVSDTSLSQFFILKCGGCVQPRQSGQI